LRRDAEAGADTDDFDPYAVTVHVLRHQQFFIDTLLQKRCRRREART
jgi:hypothetical protein